MLLRYVFLVSNHTYSLPSLLHPKTLDSAVQSSVRKTLNTCLLSRILAIYFYNRVQRLQRNYYRLYVLKNVFPVFAFEFLAVTNTISDFTNIYYDHWTAACKDFGLKQYWKTYVWFLKRKTDPNGSQRITKSKETKKICKLACINR